MFTQKNFSCSKLLQDQEFAINLTFLHFLTPKPLNEQILLREKKSITQKDRSYSIEKTKSEIATD